MFVDTIVHLIFCAPQIAVRAHVCAYVYLDLHLLQRQNVVEQKVNFRSIPLGFNPEPILGTRLFFIEKETTERSADSLEPNNRQLSVNCVWKQWTWSVIPSVCWFKTVRLLAIILIRTSRPCTIWDFADYLDTSKYPHKGRNFIYLSQIIDHVETSDLEKFLRNNMADCCVNKQLKVTAKVYR